MELVGQDETFFAVQGDGNLVARAAQVQGQQVERVTVILNQQDGRSARRAGRGVRNVELIALGRVIVRQDGIGIGRPSTVRQREAKDAANAHFADQINCATVQ